MHTNNVRVGTKHTRVNYCRRFLYFFYIWCPSWQHFYSVMDFENQFEFFNKLTFMWLFYYFHFSIKYFNVWSKKIFSCFKFNKKKNEAFRTVWPSSFDRTLTDTIFGCNTIPQNLQNHFLIVIYKHTRFYKCHIINIYIRFHIVLNAMLPTICFTFIVVYRRLHFLSRTSLSTFLSKNYTDIYAKSNWSIIQNIFCCYILYISS